MYKISFAFSAKPLACRALNASSERREDEDTKVERNDKENKSTAEVLVFNFQEKFVTQHFSVKT